jgi:Ca-activated chloride channel homolog
MLNRSKYRQSNRRGATVMSFVFLLPVLIAIVAFSVEIGRIYLVRSQLQSAVDAGALAAALKLRDVPDDVNGAIAVGLDFVQRNRVGSFVTVPKDAITIQSGTWDSNSRSFIANGIEPDTIQVSGTLDKEPLFFGKFLGLSTFAVPRTAVAIGGGNPMDIIMALDLSGSMGSQGRIQALSAAAPTFIDVLQDVGDNDRVGVMGYGALKSKYNPGALGHTGVAYFQAPAALYPPDDEWCGVLEAPLTFDLNFIRSHVLNSITLISNKYNGWTPVGAALRDSAHYLSQNARSGAEKAIVLMSDGHANKPNGNGPGYALNMANYAAGLKIKVYTISLGNAADENLMQQIADITGGEHFRATGAKSDTLTKKLSSALERIADAIKQTQLVQ